MVKMSDEEWVPEWAQVQIVREHDARTHVAFGALGKFPNVELTPDEALEIARALTLLATAVKAERAPQL